MVDAECPQEKQVRQVVASSLGTWTPASKLWSLTGPQASGARCSCRSRAATFGAAAYAPFAGWLAKIMPPNTTVVVPTVVDRSLLNKRIQHYPLHRMLPRCLLLLFDIGGITLRNMTLLMLPRLQTAMPHPSNTRLSCAAIDAGDLGPPDHTADRLKIAPRNLQQAWRTRTPLVIPICKTFVFACVCV